MYSSQEIANRIKSQAKKQRLSVNQLLLNCGLGKNTIAKISTGTDILTQNFAKIADELNCSVDYLLGRTDVPEVNRTAKVISIAEQFEKADSAKVAAYDESTHTIDKD